MAETTFRASGLASGLDTASIIDQLVKLESRPINLIKEKQAGLQSQVSAIAEIASKLSDLATAVKGLSDSGTVGTKVTSTNVGFTALSGTTASNGSYDVSVGSLAAAATARSQGFAAGQGVAPGNLTVAVNGAAFNITLTDGMALQDVAFAIRQSGAPVSAVVLSDGTSSYLSITNRNTGYTIGSQAADALQVTETTNGAVGTTGQPLNAAITRQAVNAEVTVNGLSFTRQSNNITDAIPGVTLNLKALTTAPEVLNVDNDMEGTGKNLGKFVDAYNGVLSLLQKQLAVSADVNRGSTLAGDGTVRALQRSLQSLLTTTVGSADVRTLADLGVKTARDGSITLDNNVLTAAMGRNPAAVNNLFSQASTGLGALTKTLVDGYTNSVDGMLTTRRTGLRNNIRSLDTDVATLERRIESFRSGLVAQFTAMEKTVSGLRSVGNFLTQQSSSNSGGS